MVRFYQFALSGFFAGIAGGLYVLIYEIVTFDTVAAAKSANALLMTYIGGAGDVLRADPRRHRGRAAAERRQPAVSNAWLLYVGVLFIVMVMFAPGGIDRARPHAPADRAHRAAAAGSPCPMRGIPVPGAARGAGLRAAGRAVLLHSPSAPRRARRSCSRRPRSIRRAPLPWADRRGCCSASAASGCGARRARFRAALGRGDRGDQGGGGASHERDRDPRSATCTRASARPRSSAASTSTSPRGAAPRHHRPQRRRQDHAVQPDQRALSRLELGTIELNGRSIDGLAPHQINRLGLSRSFQITSIFPRMTVFENIRCGLLWSRGYRYSFWHLLGGERALNEAAERLLERLNLAEPARRAGGPALLCRAARARDRHHHRRRRRHHPARRADRRHEPQRDRPRGRR